MEDIKNISLRLAAADSEIEVINLLRKVGSGIIQLLGDTMEIMKTTLRL